MEREQIIKALECCANNDECVGEACPYYATGCEKSMPKDALSLINELTEENERLAKLSDDLGRDVDVKLKRILELEETYDKELDRLNAEKADVTYFKKQLIADTVRKMQEEINKTLSALCKGDISEIHRIVDQIAKEMLEGTNEEG